jgi:hypothetical protein
MASGGSQNRGEDLSYHKRQGGLEVVTTCEGAAGYGKQNVQAREDEDYTRLIDGLSSLSGSRRLGVCSPIQPDPMESFCLPALRFAYAATHNSLGLWLRLRGSSGNYCIQHRQ